MFLLHNNNNFILDQQSDRKLKPHILDYSWSVCPVVGWELVGRYVDKNDRGSAHLDVI